MHAVNRKSIFVLIFITTLALLGFPGNNGAQEYSSSKPRQLKIGLISSLTGITAEIGKAVTNGFEMAQRENPSMFSNLKFIVEDHAYEARKAVSAYRKLRDYDDIDLLVCWGEPMANALAPILEKDKFSFLALSIDPTPAIGRENVLRVPNYSEQYVLKLLEYLRSKNIQKFAVIKAEDPFFNQLYDALRKNLLPSESLELLANVMPEENDFRAIIPRLKNSQIDALGVYLEPGQVSVFHRQLGLGLKNILLFGTDSYESASEIKDAGPSAEGVIYPNISVPVSFHDSYVKFNGNDIQLTYAYLGFLSARLIGDTLNSPSPTLRREDILGLLINRSKEAKEYTYRSSPEGGQFLEFPLLIKEIRNRRLINAYF